MVSEKKKQKLKEVKEDLKNYKVIGIVDMFKLPARQLHDIRNKLREDAVIKMVKKRIIKLALKECGLKNIEELDKYVEGEPALLLSNSDPFKLARTIGTSKSKASAKAGDVAPIDIVVHAGPTSLPLGPVIGELQRAKIPAAVDAEKIVVREDTAVAKEGDVIDKGLADILSKLGIEPMEIGLNLVAAWENGYVYGKDILFVSVEKYIDDLKTASSQAFSLTYSINYYTKENMPFFLSKAHQEAHSLAVAADILTSDTVKPLLAKAHAQADVLEGMVKEPEPVKEGLKEGAKETRKEVKEESEPEKKKEEEKGKEKKEEAKKEKKPEKKEVKEKKQEKPKEEKKEEVKSKKEKAEKPKHAQKEKKK